MPLFSVDRGGPSSREGESRLLWLTGLAGLAYFLLAVRLFHLQIIHGTDMLRLAEENRTQVVPLMAPRGRVLDRNGEPLLDNAPRFSLFYSNLSVGKEDARRFEAELLALFPDRAAVLKKRLVEARRSGKMARLLAGVPRETALGLIERRITLPGVHVVVEPQRRARFGKLACHVLGYVDEVSPQELQAFKDDRFRSGQFIGKMGVEKLYDGLLRGVDGGLQFEMDAKGRHLHVMRRIPTQPGRDLTLTLDRVMQAAAERGLSATSSGKGAVAAVDPRTGAVLALVSMPGFDPTDLAAGLLEDPGLPLYNRALQGTYPPGSIFKVVTAVAALEAGWDTARAFLCPGVFRLGNKDFKCWKVHGRMNFMDALAWSCDFYYYNMGLRVGTDALEICGRLFGFGERSGIDLSSESSGVLPGRDWKRRTTGTRWVDGDTVNLSIGQGFLTVTPLQAAMMVAAVANEGTLWRPRVVDHAGPPGETVYQSMPQERRRIELSTSTWATVRQAMEETVKRGTGGGAFRPDLAIGGKTGTAQNPHGEDHAWFAAYAGRPGEPPSLALVALVENGGHGADAALPVVREILKEAFPLP